MARTGSLSRKISGKVTGKGTNLTKKTRPQKKKTPKQIQDQADKKRYNLIQEAERKRNKKAGRPEKTEDWTMTDLFERLLEGIQANEKRRR